MQSSMQKYRKRMLTLSIMLLVIILLSGVSYAIFTNYVSQTDANTLAASCMDLDFNGQNEINLTNTYPVQDGEALEKTPYTFTIKNKCDNYIEYYVIASVINTSNILDSKYVKVSLLGDSDLTSSPITNLETIATPQSLSEYNITSNYVLKKGDGISKDESRTFSFRMWINGALQDSWTSEDVENKNYQVKISVVGTVKTRPKDDLFIATTIDGKASSTFPETSNYTATVACTQDNKTVDIGAQIKWTGSKWSLSVSNLTSGNTQCNVTFTPPTILKDTILANNEVKTPITTPGKEVSTESEALLASTEDDYGTSYYFRGAVKNNYVEFANKCWRIVRITGDGSVKLVLHNDNINSVNNPCSSANNSDTAALAHDNGTPYDSKFNSSGLDNTYVGFMYGTASSSDYASTHANTNKSTILTNLETWYKNNLVSYTDKLADTIWCNDKSTVTGGLGYGTNATTYAASNRISTNQTPSLICPNDNNGGKLSKFTVDDTTNGNGNLTYKIGLLTADEVAYAGLIYKSNNITTYLYENAICYVWWTLSPNAQADAGDVTLGTLVFGVYASSSTGQLYPIQVEQSLSGPDVIYGIRPSISLVSSTMATGTGTSEDPYVVN